MKHIVQIEQIVEGHEINWVNETFLVQKSPHLEIFVIHGTLVVKLNLIEIPFSVVKLIDILL